MGSLSQTIEEHPALIGLAVLGVALLAYWQSRNAPAQAAYAIGGGVRGQTDAGAVAIEQANIAAGSANVGTLAQLVGLEHSNDSAVKVAGYGKDVSIFQSGAARDLGLAQTSAAKEASIFQTASAERTRLADIAANERVAFGAFDLTHYQTDQNTVQAKYRTDADVRAAEITAQSQREASDANKYAAKLAADNQNFAIQADKDKARAAANAGIVTGIVHTIGDVLSALNPFHWF